MNVIYRNSIWVTSLFYINGMYRTLDNVQKIPIMKGQSALHKYREILRDQGIALKCLQYLNIVGHYYLGEHKLQVMGTSETCNYHDGTR